MPADPASAEQPVSPRLARWTFERYGYLPGAKDEAAAMLDAYLEQATAP